MLAQLTQNITPPPLDFSHNFASQLLNCQAPSLYGDPLPEIWKQEVVIRNQYPKLSLEGMTNFKKVAIIGASGANVITASRDPKGRFDTEDCFL